MSRPLPFLLLALLVAACRTPGPAAVVAGRTSDALSVRELGAPVADLGLSEELRAAGTPASAPARRESTHHNGIWTVTFENDLFAGVDTNYSSGFAISRTGDEVTRHPEGSFYRRIVDAASFLPGIGEEDRQHFVGFSLGQTMFTPEDITLATPPSDDRPYAGFLFFNTSLFARDEDSLHNWTLQLGIVGPSSMAEDSQKAIHDLLGSDEPQGWDHQLEDEPILNLNYQYSRRLAQGDLGAGYGYDVTPNVGGGLGNFATFANTGVSARIGSNMPDSFGGNSLTAGTQSHAAALTPISDRWGSYLFASLQGYWVGRYLPLDGNTWHDGPSVESEDWLGSASAGLAVGCKSFVAVLGYSAFSRTFETQDQRSEFGALSLSWSR